LLSACGRLAKLLADAAAHDRPLTLRTHGTQHVPALAEFVYEPFAQQASVRLEERRLACLEARIEAELALALTPS
jgi:hypothetical protein